jgi:putative peptidoglycan lipid II flippase
MAWIWRAGETLRRWRGRSLERHFLASLLTIGVLSVAVKLLGVGKDLLLASRFGVGDALDAFLIALAVPTFVASVLAGSLTAALVPVLVATERTSGRSATEAVVRNVLGLAAILFVSAAFCLAALGPWILRHLAGDFGEQKLELTLDLYYLLLPMIPLTGIATIWGAVLNAGERFALTSVVPAITPVTNLVALATMGRGANIRLLTFSVVAGLVCELVVLGIGLRRRGFRVSLRFPKIDEPTRQVLAQYGPMVAGALLASSSPLVDQFMATKVGQGSVSALSYGNKLIAFGIGIGSTALGTAALPVFSNMVVRGDWAAAKRTLFRFSRLILALTVPLVALTVLFSRPIVDLLFQRGAMTREAVASIAQIQACYVLQVPFYLMSILGVRLLSAMSLNRIIMRIAAFNVVLNVVADYLFMRAIGVAGIALSTSLVYFVSTVAVFVSLTFELRGRTQMADRRAGS